MRPRGPSGRRRRRGFGHRHTALWLVASLFAAAAFALLTAQKVHHDRVLSARAAELAQDPDDDADDPAALPTRPVYRYSVIPGGAYSASELADAIERDPVVGAAYRTISAHGVRPEVVPGNRLAYMSYRIGDQIYWAKHQIQLRRGETILTDGVTELRGRCGNGISLEPMLPTSDREPAPVELEALSPAESSLLPSRRLAFELAGVAGGRSPGLRSVDDLGLSFASGGGGPFGGPASSLDLAPGLLPGTPPDGSTSPFPPAVETVPAPGVPAPDVPIVPTLPIVDNPVFPPTDGGTPPGPQNPTESPSPNPEGPPPGGPSAPPPIPEPGTLLLVGGGGIAMLMRRLRMRRNCR